MKAKYVKPALVMERFELTQAIANGCNADPNSSIGDPMHYTKTTCAWNVNGTLIFIAGSGTGCMFGDAETQWSGLCYNNPDGGQTIFGS